MKTKYLFLLGIIAVFTGCSSAYRVGQTPDDVYYSPAPQVNTYVTTTNQQDRDSYGYNNNYNSEDFAIRRGINDPRYRSNISLDFGYGYNPYDYYGSSFYSPYSSYYSPYSYPGISLYPYNYYSSYSSYYNYYYPPVYYTSKSSGVISNYRGPRQYNMGVYNNTNINRGNNQSTQPTTSNSVPVRTFSTQPANTTGVGNLIRRVFTPSNNSRTYNNNNSNNNNNYNNNNSNNSTPSRSFQTNTNSSNNSSSSGSNNSSSGGGGSAPVRTFRR
jgi:hypothetical protein